MAARWYRVAIAALAALSLMTADAAAQTLRPAAPPGRSAVPGEIVVGFKAGVAGSQRAAARSAAGVRASRNLQVRGAQLVRVQPGQSVQDAIAELERRPDVRYAEPNWIRYATATTPNDPQYGSLWGLDNTGQAVNGHAAGTADADIDAPDAWDRNRGSASTVVAVVDTGVAWDHPDLAPNIWSNPGEIAGNGVDDDHNGKVDDVRGWDFAYGDNNPWDYDGHGTHVAGTIAARGNNGVGIIGVAWQASIMAVEALDANGSGNDANIANAFAYAAENGAKVVNASLGGPGFAQVLSDAITDHPDTLYVVSAGNVAQNNDTTPTYPCSYTADNLICVAATDNADNLASFSNYGALSVDLAAPGVDIYSARPHSTDAFNEDFETSLANWTVQSGPWGRVSASGSVWLADSPSGNYSDNADWAIRTTSKIDLGTRADCAASLRYATSLENGFDWLYLQSSADGTTWTDVTRLGDTGLGIRTTKVPLRIGGSRFYRLRLTSDDTVNKDGVFIDSVGITCPGGTYGASDYQFLDGTSMASPHVAGAATVLFSDMPAATVAEVRSALLVSGDAKPGLSGKTVTGRRLNLNAALAALPVDTTTTITSDDPDPSIVGQAVTVHYTVANNVTGGATPTGNVTVTDGVSSCTGTVAAGQCTLTFPAAGSRSLTATYAGDGKHHASPPSAVAFHQVDQADTTTTVISDDPDPSVVGQVVTVKYSVAVDAPGAGTPTGDVTVSDGVDSCTAAVDAGSCDIGLTTAGSRTLTATYAGSPTLNGSSATVGHIVVRLDSTTAISSHDPDPSVAGQAVTVKYSVTAAAGGGTPTGDVTVTDGTRSCTGTVAAGQCAITFTTAGTKSLTATFAGDATHDPSASIAAMHQVELAATTSSITSDDPDPSSVAQAVTVKYGVAVDAPGAGTPTGSVTVSDGISSCTGTVGAGQCAITLATAGSRSLTATYGGDSNFSGSASATAAHTVNKLATTAAISADDPDPSVVGQPVTVKYSVSGLGTLTENVTVTDGARSCTATVAAGQCTITFTTAGAKALTATYAGDATHSASPASTAVSHRVDAAGTTTTVISDDPDPSVVGQAVKVKYSVGVSTPGAGTPTGNVTVSDGVDSCSATVAAGSCDVTMSTSGVRALTAHYAGSDDYEASTSEDESHRVTDTVTTTAINSDSPDASLVGQPVDVHFGVTSARGAPPGSVTVSAGTTSCTATVAAGHCALTFMSAGAKQLTAKYAGEGTFGASSSAAERHTVDPAATSTTITADDPDPSAQGTGVTVRYRVTVNAPAAGTPTGVVRVTDGVSACTGTVAARQCTITLAAAGGRTLTASYAGNEDFRASRSSAARHTVNAPATGSPPTMPSGAPPAIDSPPLPAHLTGATQAHPRFRVSPKSKLVRVSRRRAPVGTRFTYTLDLPATVRFDFIQPRAGRKANGKCVPPRKRNRRKPKCTLRRGSLTFAAHPGSNTVRFNGWLSRKKKLTPGNYALVMTAITPGAGETSQKLRFTIVR